MEEKVLIIDSSPRAINFAIQEEATLFMGIERGAWKLAQNNIKMIMAIGDFDSISETELSYLKSVTNVIRLPSNKKHSDMESALILAKSYGFTKIYIICDIARLDQLLMNIELVKKYSLTMFTNFGMIVKLVPAMGNVYIRKGDYSFISFFPITKKVHLTTSNALAYPLPSVLKQSEVTTYISNEMIGPVLSIELHEGELLVVQAIDPQYKWKDFRN